MQIQESITNFYDVAATHNVPAEVIEQFNEAVGEWLGNAVDTDEPLPKFSFERYITSPLVGPRVIIEIAHLKRRHKELTASMRDVYLAVDYAMSKKDFGDLYDAASFMCGFE